MDHNTNLHAGGLMTVGMYDIIMPGRHGVMPQERLTGHDFKVTAEVTFPATPLILHPDSLEATVSYADIYEICLTEIQKPRQLLETVALSIAGAMTTRWPQIKSGEITIIKLSPPIPGIQGNTGVTYRF